MKLSKLAQWIGSNVPCPDADIQWLLTDSRSLSFPAETVFFALRSKRSNGHYFVSELYRQQVRYFVVDELFPEFKTYTDAVFLEVTNVLKALQQIAANHRQSFQIPIIGITGSNGKTVVKEWLYQLLQYDFRITRSPRSYNSQIGVPLSVWLLNENSELGIFEAGISEPNEMAKLQSIIKPTIGILTNIGDAHQEFFGSLKQKCIEKLKLFDQSEVLIYNADSKLIRISIAQSNFAGKLFSWGFDTTSVLQIVKLTKSLHKTEIFTKYRGIEFQFEIPFTDHASIENAMQTLACLLYLDLDMATIAARMKTLETVAMRLEVKEGIRNCCIINDSYNSDLNSLTIALDFLNQQTATNSLERTLILSDILQSGQSLDVLYRVVSELIKSKNIHHIIGIGVEISAHKDKFASLKHSFFPNSESFLISSELFDLHDAVVLLKGSRAFHFETISAKLELMAHETILNVNLNALIDNLNYFRSGLQPQTKIMCMVKAFAYGSGALEVARTLQHHRCDYLAVAVADEGAELRREGIRIPIAVMNPEISGFGIIFDNNLEPEIYSFRLLDAFIAAAERLGIIDYPIHIKIDSGMHRLGFEAMDMDKLLSRLKFQQQVKIRSVFSHLAGADDPDLDDFTKAQFALFTQCADQISQAFSHAIFRHILNSAGIERFPQFQLGMVRLGIGLYGISAVPNYELKQVNTLQTLILQIKTIPAGDTVGYGRKGKVLHEKRIAILPIGYADGFDRKLSNGVGEVLVNAKRAKVIGNVSMDLITIDITDIEAEEGDSVEVFGENLKISEVAQWLNTIPYEILTNVSRRVKRIYFQQ